MVRGKLAAAATATVGALMLAAYAGAATPQEIYRDLALDGRLDGTYSKAELGSALKDLTVQGYSSPTAKAALQAAVAARAPASTSQRRALAVTAGTPRLPFTGLDLVWVALAGVVLLGLGTGLRQLARR